VLPEPWRRHGSDLSVSYPADRRLQALTGFSSSLFSRSLSVSYPADRRLQGRQLANGVRARRHFQYPILRIVGCKRGAERQGRRRSSHFQYPILRIVGCKAGLAARGGSARSPLSVSYPADRRLQEKWQVETGSVWEAFQYPILRIVGCKAQVRSLALVSGTAFSILSCGSSVASTERLQESTLSSHFQYPILRIVGCK